MQTLALGSCSHGHALPSTNVVLHQLGERIRKKQLEQHRVHKIQLASFHGKVVEFAFVPARLERHHPTCARAKRSSAKWVVVQPR